MPPGLYSSKIFAIVGTSYEDNMKTGLQKSKYKNLGNLIVTRYSISSKDRNLDSFPLLMVTYRLYISNAVKSHAPIFSYH